MARVGARRGFRNIKLYKEFEISPQGEWVDLDIDLDRRHDDSGWKWNSNLNFEVSSRIDKAAHVCYGAMPIPYAAINGRPAPAGNTLRINLFRCQGPASSRHYIVGRMPMRDSFHVPEGFGTLQLME